MVVPASVPIDAHNADVKAHSNLLSNYYTKSEAMPLTMTNASSYLTPFRLIADALNNGIYYLRTPRIVGTNSDAIFLLYATNSLGIFNMGNVYSIPSTTNDSFAAFAPVVLIKSAPDDIVPALRNGRRVFGNHCLDSFVVLVTFAAATGLTNALDVGMRVQDRLGYDFALVATHPTETNKAYFISKQNTPIGSTTSFDMRTTMSTGTVTEVGGAARTWNCTASATAIWPIHKLNYSISMTVDGVPYTWAAGRVVTGNVLRVSESMQSIDPRLCYDYMILHRGENPQLTNSASVADCEMQSEWTFYGNGSALNDITFKALRTLPSATYLYPWQFSPITPASSATLAWYVPRATNFTSGILPVPAAETTFLSTAFVDQLRPVNQFWQVSTNTPFLGYLLASKHSYSLTPLNVIANDHDGANSSRLIKNSGTTGKAYGQGISKINGSTAWASNDAVRVVGIRSPTIYTPTNNMLYAMWPDGDSIYVRVELLSTNASKTITIPDAFNGWEASVITSDYGTLSIAERIIVDSRLHVISTAGIEGGIIRIRQLR
jgi:hypothetical protein